MNKYKLSIGLLHLRTTSEVEVEFVLFSFSVPWYCGVEDRSYPFALVLPFRIVGLRNFAHKGTIHQTQLFLFVHLHWFIALRATLVYFIGLSYMISISALTRRSASSEPTGHGLSKLVRLCFIWKKFIRQLLITFFVWIFCKDYLMNSSFLLSWFESIDKGQIIYIKLDLDRLLLLLFPVLSQVW